MPTWMFKFFGIHFMVPPGEGGGGETPPPPAGKGETPPDAAAIAAENAALKARIAALEKPPEDPSLRDKAIKDRENADREAANNRNLESSIAYTMKADDFLKVNGPLLPNEVADIFQRASKENYANANQKAAAIKSGVIESFFAQQANYDILTAGQKAILDDFRKLTKDHKQEKASSVYETIFEPTLERLRDARKAAALRGGLHDGNGGADEQYRNKMASKSMKHYGLEK